jgi:tetratricopeptide (TPR) repeat protein
VLVTSRRRADAVAERQDITPLPDPKAIALLQAWGGERAGDKEAARRICELVGGLPLAVRLAGRYLAEREEEAADYLAWLEETPLVALDHGDRQDESVPLLLKQSLDQVSQAASASLAVVGTLALAPFAREAVAAALEVSPRETGRALGELVAYGLLMRDDARYQASHALVRTYARRRLAPPAEVIDRLTDYYVVLAEEQSALGLPGYAVLDAERPHLMALLKGCLEREAWDQARALAWAVGNHEGYLDMQGHWTERITALEAGLTAAQASPDGRSDEGAFLGNLGNAHLSKGQTDRAVSYYEQALAIAREVGDRRREGAWLGNLGAVHYSLGQATQAVEYFEGALVIAREMDDRRNEGNFLGNLGLAYSDLGQVARAVEYHEEALAVARKIGDRRNEGTQFGNLGIAYRALGQVTQATECYAGALAIAREIGDRGHEETWLGNLGTAYRDLGQVARAIEYHEQALAIAREIGDRGGEGANLGSLGLAYGDMGQLEQATEYLEGALGIAREIGDRRNEGNWLGGLGVAYRALGQMARAVEYHEEALRISREIGDRYSESTELGNLGIAYRALGNLVQARACLESALAILEEIKSPHAELARAQLAELEDG